MGSRFRWITALVLAGCASRGAPPAALPRSPSEFRRLELPGFSLDVPAGLGVGEGNIAEYHAGSVTMRGSSRVFNVSWVPGWIALGDQLTEMVRARIIPLFPGKPYELREAQTMIAGPHLAGVVEFTVEHRALAWMEIECGKRMVTLLISGPQLTALRDHLLDSFDCHPIAAADLALIRSPISVDDPNLLRDWYEIPHDHDLMISNGVFTVMFQLTSTSELTTAEFRDSLSGLIKAATGGTWSNTRLEKRWTRDGERIFQYGAVESGGDQRLGLFVAWRCQDQAVSGLALPHNADTDFAPLEDLIMKLRCPRPDDPPLHLRQGPP